MVVAVSKTKSIDCIKKAYETGHRDFGENKIETPVKINSIELKYNSDSIVIDALVLEHFFHPNIYLEKGDSGYLRKTLNGRYDPFLVSTPLLEKKIELEF